METKINKHNFVVRPMEEDEVSFMLDYWQNCTPEDLERMGVDVKKIPLREIFKKNILDSFANPIEKTKSFYLTWYVGDVAIGFTSLKNIIYSESGEMHLHIWDVSSRGKGYGAVLFCKAALEFYRIFNLKKIICEPRAINPMPNGMLKKIGFPLVKTHEKASSELSLFCELNQYDINKETAIAYLDQIP
ncbi:MAG: hypothetical protein M9962_13045 [Oligoflexia bacterium]|nr:hypothetical protein [Oligoflexia bacterium]